MVMGMMYPNPRTERRRLIYLLIISISFWPVYVMWFYDVFHCLQRLDVDNLTRQLSLGVPIMFCQFKMFLVTILRKKMQNLIEEINADYERYNCMDAGYQAIVMENQKSLLKLEKVWTYMVLATVAAFPLMALYQTTEHHLFKEGQRFMVHDVDVPWLKEQRFESPYFEILFVYMVYIALVLVLCYTAYDGMFFLCIFHACLKMKIISHQLMGALRDHDDVEQMKRNIAVVVEDQCETFRFVDRIREEYEFWLVQVFGLTGIQICMNMYQIITSDGSDIDPRYIIFFVAAILHIYVPCFLVSKLSATAAEVSNSAYCAGWEQLADSGVRRSIAIMIARAQIPVQVQALNMVTFNMELFVSVMQTSYSVFTLLRS
ncbi:odorant receptor 30a [Plutella xylostella]|nr:odorant receptor 30a [Plutella xylostella]